MGIGMRACGQVCGDRPMGCGLGCERADGGASRWVGMPHRSAPVSEHGESKRKGEGLTAIGIMSRWPVHPHIRGLRVVWDL
jgi:hypothetical protein